MPRGKSSRAVEITTELFRNRIVGYGIESPKVLAKAFNPDNYREHPLYQQEATRAILREIGWVQTVLKNKRTGNMIDGHLRVTLALDSDEPGVPVTYCDLSREEEKTILAVLDPLTGLAQINYAKHRGIVWQRTRYRHAREGESDRTLCKREIGSLESTSRPEKKCPQCLRVVKRRTRRFLGIRTDTKGC